jgi:hypothetical protein
MGLFEDIINSQYFIFVLAFLIGGTAVYIWLSKRQKEAPEAKFGYGKKIWNEIIMDKIKATMNSHAIKPRIKKNFIVGNERFGQIARYMNVLVTPGGKIGYRIESPGAIGDELKELRGKIIDLEYDKKYANREESGNGSTGKPNDTGSKA